MYVLHTPYIEAIAPDWLGFGPHRSTQTSTTGVAGAISNAASLSIERVGKELGLVHSSSLSSTDSHPSSISDARFSEQANTLRCHL